MLYPALRSRRKLTCVILDPIDIYFQYGRQLSKLFVQFIREVLPVLFDTALEMTGETLEFFVFILNLYFYLLSFGNVFCNGKNFLAVREVDGRPFQPDDRPVLGDITVLKLISGFPLSNSVLLKAV